MTLQPVLYYQTTTASTKTIPDITNSTMTELTPTDPTRNSYRPPPNNNHYYGDPNQQYTWQGDLYKPPPMEDWQLVSCQQCGRNTTTQRDPNDRQLLTTHQTMLDTITSLSQPDNLQHLANRTSTTVVQAASLPAKTLLTCLPSPSPNNDWFNSDSTTIPSTSIPTHLTTTTTTTSRSSPLALEYA